MSGIIKLYILFIFFQFGQTYECNPRDYGHGSIVCVCNSTYCDSYESVSRLKVGQFWIYTSNRDGLRFNKTIGSFSQKKNQHADNFITINPNVKQQEIFGWGGAFTDATGYNLNLLNNNTRKNLLRSYFSNDGLEYSLCRVQIAASDFSPRDYSYDNYVNDTSLSKFNLTYEDYYYKIPYILEAIALTNNKLQLFASSWSPPFWMKTNNYSAGMGFLKAEFYQSWADYHLKFLDAYGQQGINFWGLTTGNEPTVGFWPLNKLNSLNWLPWDQGKWITENLGPAIRNSKYKELKIIAFDDERILLPFWLILEFYGTNATNYVDGIGVHWYADNLFPFLLGWTHLLYPDQFVLGTEACAGDIRFKQKVILGSWKRGEMYVDDIIEDLEYWVTGWVDWNLALNLKGGPSYVGNKVDSSILINHTAQEFYKQPTYYTMGHFSKFVPASSRKIESTITAGSVKVAAFTRPDNGTTVVVYNKHNSDAIVTIHDPRRGFININILKRSVNTLVYW